MNFLKKIQKLQTLQSEISALPKFYYSHVWVTPPATDGFSYLGLSQFAKRYIVRFNKFVYEGYTKTNYGIANRFHIEAFINETKQRKERGQLNLSEQMEWQRFQIKKNQPFVLMEAIQFDIQLLAPLNMRVIDYQYNTLHKFYLLTAPYFFQVQLLQPNQLTTLLNQQEYNKIPKMLRF